ncbi:MAG: hypothetical protein ACKOSR_10305, partial [Flavobacteriales bacterium]
MILILGVSMAGYAQIDTVCLNSNSVGNYIVDAEENGGLGTTNAQYIWSVIAPGAIISNNGANSVSVNWSNVLPGEYTLEVIETDLITLCQGNPVEIQVVVLEPILTVIQCTPVSGSQVNFEWNDVQGAIGYNIEVYVNDVLWNSLTNYTLTQIDVTGLNPGDEVSVDVSPLGIGQTCFGIGSQTCNSAPCDPTAQIAAITVNEATSVITCSNTSIDVTASGGVSYSWSSGLGNAATANISAPGTYTVTVTAANGCTDTENIAVTQDITAPVAAITVNEATTVITCANTSIDLTATGGVSYNWSGGLGSSSSASAGTSGVYTVTVTALNGCTDTESITITDDGSVPVAVITNNTGTTE